MLDAARALEALALDAPLTPGDRAWIGSTASRLRALAASLAEPPPPDPEDVEDARRPSRTFTRKEAARRARVSHNTLLRWEEAGRIAPGRDARGWRVYTVEDVARARALARREPVSPLPEPVRRLPVRAEPEPVRRLDLAGWTVRVADLPELEP